jgi:predicted metalloprotease
VLRRRRRVLVATLSALAVAATAIVLVVALTGGSRSWYGDPFDRFPGGGSRGTEHQVGGAPNPRSQTVRFLTFVVGDIQGFWAREFRRSDRRYIPAPVVVFRRALPTPCGTASAATGPFYCRRDGSVYLDLGFFRELAVRFHAPGDFAEAYVLAHEIGHHVQDLLGITQAVDQAAADGQLSPQVASIGLELQADCLAGVWAHSTYERRLLERGDLDEALRAAAAVGDDRIQRQTIGRVIPETWTHGSSQQRRSWLLRGFEAGEPDTCDTFSSAA